jgi:hypothetical protein
MEALSRFVARAGAALVLAAVAGCASTPEREVSMTLPAPVFRSVMVQSIPRGAWVERGNEYIGVAPIEVPVRVRSNGHAWAPTVIRVQDWTGAWERKVLTTAAPVPERMLFDLRGLSGYQPGVTLGP